MTPLEYFLAQVACDSYPEPQTEGHSEITRRMFDVVMPLIPPGGSVLDVGCGQGPALALCRKYGFKATGVDINPTNLAACREAGFFVHEMDQNQLILQDNIYDLVWARHVLEHSIMPMWTLHEFFRVCKPGGLLYVEVPAPDTSSHHETNRNHYSCLTWSTWHSLIARTGFDGIHSQRIALSTPMGPDEYWAFICRKGRT